MQCRQQPTLISFLSNNSNESHLLLAILLSAISAASSAESILCTHQYLSTLILGLFQDKQTCHRKGFERADEEIRTLDILLGKEMLYH